MKEKLVKATYEGSLTIGEFEMKAYNLDNGERVLSREGLLRAIGRKGNPKYKESELFQLPVFLRAKNLNPFVSKELNTSSKPIIFERAGGIMTYGYLASILPDICYVFDDAEKAGVLNKRQQVYADRCSLLLRGFATVGIIALVDEATGYQDVRVQKALEKILNEFLLKEKKPYIGMFPIEFYKEIYRLNSWSWTPENTKKRPGVIGKWTNDIIYARLAPGLLKEIQKRNPTIKPGQRKYKNFQFLTDKVGDPALKAHFDGILALQRASANWRKFKELINRAYPRYGDTIPLNFDIEE